MGKTVVAHFFDSWCKFTWLVIAKRVICCDVVYGSQNDTSCDGDRRSWVCPHAQIIESAHSDLMVEIAFITGETGIRGLMTGMATLPQGNQELLVVRDKVGRPPSELGVSESMECDIFHSVLWHCWLGDRKGIRPVKSWMLVC